MKIVVHSKPPRFRRAGVEFTHEKRLLDTDHLTAEQLAAIEAEPMLVVEHAKKNDDGRPALPQSFISTEQMNAAQAEIMGILTSASAPEPGELPTDKPSKKKPKG